VWLIALPQLLFIPDRDGDDVPDGPPEVVLDGFGISPDNYHNCASGLKWGPDGWLYGRNGASSPGWIGPPGATDDQRVPIFGGLWRYHPQRKVFETLCHGTTNPWGHDWDEHGELFFTNTVTGHLFHMIPGAHYTRSATVSVNPRVYAPIDTHADHLHWDTGRGINYREAAHAALGGGHAHCGAMIYQGDQWPAELRGKLLTLNFHGRRMNVERLEREGSGYAALHEPDMAFAEDQWFRGIDLNYGPDGSVYVIDWSDTGECHEHDGIHRLSGRVFRFSYGEPRGRIEADLTRLSPLELVGLHAHANEWFVRAARRELANRAAAGGDVAEAVIALRRTFDEGDNDAIQKLRALWTLYTLDAMPREDLLSLLDHGDEHVRVWGLRLLTDFWPIDTVHGTVRAAPETIDPALVPRLTDLAKHDPSGLVRLVLASTIQRLPLELRAHFAAQLAADAKYADDHNLPKLLWYGLAPLAMDSEQHADGLVSVVQRGQLPLTNEWIARGLAEQATAHPRVLDKLLREAAALDESVRTDVVRGLVAGLAGRRKAERPPNWEAFQASFRDARPVVNEQLRGLAVVFGDGRALSEVRRIALDSRAPLPQRRAALETLIEARPDDLRPICEQLLRVRFLNTTALKGLTLFDDPRLGEQLARSYMSFHSSERGAVIDTLCSRPAFARGLLDQVAAGRIPRTEITPLHARQILSFGDQRLAERLAETWGELRDSPADKQQTIDRLREQLTTERLAAADLSAGRAVFHAACANCHKLYGAGGTIGPDLTGSGRHNVDYLLSNIVDPSAVVNRDYRMSIVRLADGRVLNGLVVSRDDQRLVLQTDKDQLTLPAAEIDEVKLTTLSPMPDALLQPLSEDQIRNLIAYLMGSGQVTLPLQPPMPAAP
jgi:putative membrane-bound dehydrogenase-like protein